MTLRILNQKTMTYPEVDHLINHAFDTPADEYKEKVNEHFNQRLIEPLFESINQRDVTMESIDDKGVSTPITVDDIKQAVAFESSNSIIHFDLIEELNEIYMESSAHHLRSEVTYSQQGLVQLFADNNLPLPSATVVYRPYLDVIPHAQTSLSQWKGNIELFSTGVASVLGFSRLHDNHLFVNCRDSDVYDTIVESIQSQLPNIPANKMDSIKSLSDIKMNDNLTTTWILPTSQNEPHKADYSEWSLWRLAEHYIKVAEAYEEVYLPNFNFNAYKMPLYVTFVNVDAHAATNDQYITNEYDKLIQTIFKLEKLKAIPIKKLLHAESVDFDKNMHNPLDQELKNQKDGELARRVFKKLNGRAYSSKEQIKMIHRIIKRQQQVTISKNTYVTKRKTFNRANRREPFNLNKKGVKKHTAYRPDIHIFADTSGSISERHYKTSILNIIKIAKIAKVNIYFSSFSHIISEPVYVQTKGKSAASIYKEILHIPKVSGGTDFSNVWRAIREINKREPSPRTNFIISDMEYHVQKGELMRKGTAEVDSTYYVPISVSQAEYERLKKDSEGLIKGLIRNGHRNARSHFVM